MHDLASSDKGSGGVKIPALSLLIEDLLLRTARLRHQAGSLPLPYVIENTRLLPL
jgi:hypothetical protein